MIDSAQPSLPESPSESGLCLDCGAEVTGQYCPDCGQRWTDPTRIPLKELLVDGLGNLVGLDSRLRRTLPLLFFRPGELTKEYTRGRRTRYVPPLRLFLFMSLALLTVLSFTEFTLSTSTSTDQGESNNDVVAFSWNPGEGESSTLQAIEKPESSSITTNEKPQEEALESEAEGEAEGEEIEELDEEGLQRGFLDHLPQGLFLMTPFFGFYLFVIFRRRYPFYAPHFIFSLHYHAFIFALICVTSSTKQLLGPVVDDLTSIILLLSMVIYLFVAIRRFYSTTFVVTFFALLALLVVHFFTFLFTLLGIVMFVLKMG